MVIVSLDEWNAMKESLHLLRTPERARRLLESIAQADAGLTQEQELIDPDAMRPESGGDARAVA